MIILEECLFYKVFVEIYCLGDFGLRLLQKSFNFATNLHQADIFGPQKQYCRDFRLRTTVCPFFLTYKPITTDISTTTYKI